MTCIAYPTSCRVLNDGAVFNNVCSYGHALLGLLFGKSGPKAQAAIGIGFMLYEMNRCKPANAKLGAYSEFASGFLVGRAIS
jgi:hypothetical protein